MVEKKSDRLLASEAENTVVDLGDDLLEKTAVVSRSESHSDFESAKILFQEGLVEDAKKILRAILVSDPDHVQARQLLEKAQKEEEIQILNQEPRKRASVAPSFRGEENSGGHAPPETGIEAGNYCETGKPNNGHVREHKDSIEFLLEGLDKDFSLGLLSAHRDAKTPRGEDEAVHRLNEKFRAELCGAVERKLVELEAQDRQDLGIALFEIGEYQLAAQCFASAKKHWEWVYSLDIDKNGLAAWISAAVLEAVAYTELENGYQGALVLEPLLRIPALSPVLRAELLYWSGRCSELRGELGAAKGYYLQVWLLNDCYRDLKDRLGNLTWGDE